MLIFSGFYLRGEYNTAIPLRIKDLSGSTLEAFVQLGLDLTLITDTSTDFWRVGLITLIHSAEFCKKEPSFREKIWSVVHSTST